MIQTQQSHPEQRLELWVQDEGRIGLKPQIKRIWAPKGKRPVAVQKRGFLWFYVYVFVNPHTGHSDFLILPSVNVTLMQLALESFMQQINPLGDKVIVLMLDRAGWHTSKKLVLPPNLVLLPLPAYTPELSPAEPLVRKVKEPISNLTLTTLKQVQDLVAHECERLRQTPHELRSLCGFSWITQLLQRVYQSA